MMMELQRTFGKTEKKRKVKHARVSFSVVVYTRDESVEMISHAHDTTSVLPTCDGLP